jgi:hypothetical protein
MTAPKVDTGTDENRKAGELDRRYGRIGISAVAAALACMNDAKSSPSEPGETRR